MSLRRNSGDSRTTWIFGSCELDELSRRFRVDGKLVELETKPLEVLRQLLLRAGEVVTKQELLDLVWPGLVVVDGSLATAVSKLRKALNDRDATMIATVARVGYRLEATVRVRHTGEPIALAPLPGQTAGGISTSAAQPKRSRPISTGCFAAVSVVCLILLAGAVFLSSKGRLAPSGPGANSVAVLPFQNTDTNADLDFLRVGLADEVATELSNVRSLSLNPRGPPIRRLQSTLTSSAWGTP
jgi:DNA-binding winged helix-turn-helix (wHTH) protein